MVVFRCVYVIELHGIYIEDEVTVYTVCVFSDRQPWVGRNYSEHASSRRP